MTRPPQAVFEFLDWMVDIGTERGYTVSRQSDLLVDEPRFVARTRYTVNQGLNTPAWAQPSDVRFKVNDEVETRLEEVEQLYSIVLDLHDKQTWDSNRDDFYPVTASYLRRRSNEDKNGDYPVGIDLTDPALRRRRNDLDRLFPMDESF